MAKALTFDQPVSTVQWVKTETLRANNYNPNHVAPPELGLLKLSIMEDGWTQPIVAQRTGEIVDGFHRWMLACTDKDIKALTKGHVPVVHPKISDNAHQMMSTIRHNRARGTHAVLRMADIVRQLSKTCGLADEVIMRRLGMEDEEVERLLDASGMTVRGAKPEFGKGWTPT